MPGTILDASKSDQTFLAPCALRVPPTTVWGPSWLPLRELRCVTRVATSPVTVQTLLILLMFWTCSHYYLLWCPHYLGCIQVHAISSNAIICSSGHSLWVTSLFYISHLAALSPVILPICRPGIKVPVGSWLWPSHLFLSLHIIILLKTGLTTKRIQKSQAGFWRQNSCIKASTVMKTSNALKLNN